MWAVIGLDMAEKSLFFKQQLLMDTKIHQLLTLCTMCAFNTVPQSDTAMVTIETSAIETALSQSLLEETVMGSGPA